MFQVILGSFGFFASPDHSHGDISLILILLISPPLFTDHVCSMMTGMSVHGRYLSHDVTGTGRKEDTPLSTKKLVDLHIFRLFEETVW